MENDIYNNLHDIIMNYNIKNIIIIVYIFKKYVGVFLCLFLLVNHVVYLTFFDKSLCILITYFYYLFLSQNNPLFNSF